MKNVVCALLVCSSFVLSSCFEKDKGPSETYVIDVYRH